MTTNAVTIKIGRDERREAFRQDTVNSWNEYQETELHITSMAGPNRASNNEA